MQDSTRLFTVRLHENFDLVKLNQVCKVLASNKSRLSQAGLEIVMNMSPQLWERLISTAEARNYPVWAIVQTMVADYFAKYDAEIEVFGIPMGEYSFVMDGQGKPADGSILYERTKLRHQREMERDKTTELKDKAEHGLYLTDDELAFVRQQQLKALSIHSPELKKEFEDAMKRQWAKDDELRQAEGK